MTSNLSFEWLEKLSLAAILASFVFNLRSVFTVRFTPEAMGKEYESFLHGGSFFSDDKLYAWAGWLYVHGHPPNEVNFEHPPLAKYFIGLSEIFFINHSLLSFILSILTLVTAYFLSKMLIKSKFFPVLPILLLSLDKLYVTFSSVSMLDIYMVFFSTLSIATFVKSLEDRRFAPLVYVLIGLAVACKWTGVFTLFSVLAYCLWRRDRWNLRFAPLGVLLAVMAYSSTYITFFLTGHGFKDFVSLQIQMLKFQHFMRFERGTPPPLWILLHLLTGVEGPTQMATVQITDGAQMLIKTLDVRYGLSMVKAYNPFTWPLTFSASIMSLYYAWKRKNLHFAVIPMSFFALITLTSTGQVFVWYILPALPFGFIAIAYFLESVYLEAKNRKIAGSLISAYTFICAAWSLLVEVPSFIPFPHR